MPYKLIGAGFIAHGTKKQDGHSFVPQIVQTEDTLFIWYKSVTKQRKRKICDISSMISHSLFPSYFIFSIIISYKNHRLFTDDCEFPTQSMMTQGK